MDFRIFKDEAKRFGRKTILSAALLLGLSGGVKASDQPSQNDGAKDKIEQVGEQEPKIYFSPEMLVKSLGSVKVSKDVAAKFIDNYLEKIKDSDGKISPRDLIDVCKISGLSKEQSVGFFENLIGDKRAGSKAASSGLAKEELSKASLDEAKKMIAASSYNFGTMRMSASIDENGRIEQMSMSGRMPDLSNEEASIFEAICRHSSANIEDAIAIDDKRAAFVNKKLDKLLLAKLIIQNQSKGKVVENGDAYIQAFVKDMKDNGLEFSADGKIVGVEASKNNKLYTKKDLMNNYQQKRALEFQRFSQGR